MLFATISRPATLMEKNVLNVALSCGSGRAARYTFSHNLRSLTSSSPIVQIFGSVPSEQRRKMFTICKLGGTQKKRGALKCQSFGMKSFKGEGKSKVTNGMSATPAFSGGFINNLYFSRTAWPRQKYQLKYLWLAWAAWYLWTERSGLLYPNMASHPAFIDKMRLPWWPTLLFMCQSGRHWMWHAQPLQERRRTRRRGRRKVMLSITAVENPALWRRAKLLHVGVSSANFRSFPAQLNVSHEALLVIVSKFHNHHNNSETFSTNFPLKQLMHILTWRRQEKWNPAEYSSGHYRTLTHSLYKCLLLRKHSWNWKAVPFSQRQWPRIRVV